MIDDLMSKFPELIQTLLDKALSTSSPTETVERKEAREKLIKKLKSAINDLSKLSTLPGEKLDEKTIEKILSIPRPSPKELSWAFLQKNGRK